MAKNKNEETGIILKIQKQTGCLLFVIGAAMLAFVLTDFFKSGSSLIGGSSNVVGEIAGEEIGYDQLMLGVEELKLLYQGQNLDEDQLRDQSWNQMIQEKVVNREFDLLGLETGTAELNDAMFGSNPDELVVQAFADSNGNYNPNRLKDFIEIDMQENEDVYQRYLRILEIPLKDKRSREKWQNLINAGIYTTGLDAQYEFDREELKMSAIAVGLPYTMIADSSIQYDDGDLKAFLSENSADYQQLATRDIEFVVLNVFPSADDSLEVRKSVGDQIERFRKSKKGSDSAFLANWRSLSPYNARFYKRGETGLPPKIEDQLFAADSGSVTEVIETRGIYGIYKVLDFKDDTIPMMRAQHVLLPLGGESETKVKTVMADLKAGRTTFAEASKENYDGTNTNEGDLGWFQKGGAQGSVPKEVKDKVFNSSVGSYFTVLSSKGHHVVKVTHGPSRKTIQIGAFERAVSPGRNADRLVERLAGEIQFKGLENEDFELVAENEGQAIRTGTKITESKPNVQGIRDPKDIARWLFDNKTKVGDISDVIGLPDRYVVAKCIAIREKGTSELEDNREQITADYIRDEIGNRLVEQLNEALVSAKDAQSLAKVLNTDTKIVPVVNMNSIQVSGVGAEPKIVGAILGLKDGNRSEPIKGADGVYVVWNTGQVEAGETPEFNAEDMKDLFNERYRQTSGEAVIGALRKKANIIDQRYKFF